MSSERDKALAHEITTAWFEVRCPEINGQVLASAHSNPRFVLHDYIELAFATIREEARREAFSEAANAIHTMSRIDARNKSVDFLNGAIWIQDKAAKLVESFALERAAEEGNDGQKKS